MDEDDNEEDKETEDPRYTEMIERAYQEHMPKYKTWREILKDGFWTGIARILLGG